LIDPTSASISLSQSAARLPERVSRFGAYGRHVPSQMKVVHRFHTLSTGTA
jgi:hypothetical protein